MRFDAVSFLEGLYEKRPAPTVPCPQPNAFVHRPGSLTDGRRDGEPSDAPVVIRAELQGNELRLLCPSPEIYAAIEAGRARLETFFDELADAAEMAPLGDDGWPENTIEPSEPCPSCGSLAKWWDAMGGEHCLPCEWLKRERSRWLAKRATELRMAQQKVGE